MDENSNILPAPDARSLILDLFAAHHDDRFTSAELIRAGDIFGHSATAMRTAVARLCKEGRLTSPARAVYAAGSADDPWRRRIENWRDRAMQRTAWTGGWLMAAARPSSVSRAAWRATLRALDVEGFRQTPQGLWLRPDTLTGGVGACRERLLTYGATADLLTARLEQLDPVAGEALQSLWAPAGLATGRKGLLDQLKTSEARLPDLTPAEAAREALMIGRAVVRAIVRDPLLPREWEVEPSLDRLVAAMIPYNTLGRKMWLAYLER